MASSTLCDSRHFGSDRLPDWMCLSGRSFSPFWLEISWCISVFRWLVSAPWKWCVKRISPESLESHKETRQTTNKPPSYINIERVILRQGHPPSRGIYEAPAWRILQFIPSWPWLFTMITSHYWYVCFNYRYLILVCNGASLYEGLPSHCWQLLTINMRCFECEWRFLTIHPRGTRIFLGSFYLDLTVTFMMCLDVVGYWGVKPWWNVHERNQCLSPRE